MQKSWAPQQIVCFLTLKGVGGIQQASGRKVSPRIHRVGGRDHKIQNCDQSPEGSPYSKMRQKISCVYNPLHAPLYPSKSLKFNGKQTSAWKFFFPIFSVSPPISIKYISIGLDSVCVHGYNSGHSTGGIGAVGSSLSPRGKLRDL